MIQQLLSAAREPHGVRPPTESDMEGVLSSMKGRVVSRGGWRFLMFACDVVWVVIGVVR